MWFPTGHPREVLLFGALCPAPPPLALKAKETKCFDGISRDFARSPGGARKV